MTYLRPLLVAVPLLWNANALADGEKPIAYAEFAANVPHIVLAKCPNMVAAQDTTCLAAMLDDKLHLAVFSNQGDRPLIAQHGETGVGSRASLN